MKYIIIGLALLYAVDGRNLHGLNIEEDDNNAFDENNDFKNTRDHHHGQTRHQRKTRYAYEYDFLRDYHHQDDPFTKILRYLDEISWYIKRGQSHSQPAPPAAPQIIYVPYPVPYPVPQTVNNYNCLNNGSGLGIRFGESPRDPNQIWGAATPAAPAAPADTYKFIDEGEDGKGPISLDEVKPDQAIPIPPAVEHGSSQAGMGSTERPAPPRPGLCQAAIVVCCGLKRSEQKDCFIKYGCPKTFSTGLSCSPAVVKKAFEIFEEAYALD